MNLTANGTGLNISEQDAEGVAHFDMSPDLFESYLHTITADARDVQQETVYDKRYISFVSERRGLVSLIVRDTTPAQVKEENTMTQTHNGLTYVCMTCGEDAPTVARICTTCLFKVQQYEAAGNDAIVTADDIRQDRNAYNAEAAAEIGWTHGTDTTYEVYDPILGNVVATTTDINEAEEVRDSGPYAMRWGWNARLAARAASIVTAAGGLALAIACLTGTPASASTLPLVPTDGECVITRQFEDGSATALCGHDVWAYDADGNNPPASVGYTGPRWDAGWYPCIDISCAVIDHTEGSR